MSDARMHYFKKIEYDQMDMMLLSLRPGKFHKLWSLVMQYARATELGANVELPTDDDPLINGFLRAMCGRVRDDSEAYFNKVRPANQANANKRWDEAKDQDAGKSKSKSKGKGKEVKQGGAEAEAARQDAPMSFDEFTEFVGNGHNPHDVKQLYDKLQSMNWTYHGHQLDKYWTKCNACYDKRGGKFCCGMVAIVAYNTMRGYKEPVRASAFNALCDAMSYAGRGLCDVGEAMANLKVVDGEIRYNGKDFETVQNFADFLKTSGN